MRIAQEHAQGPGWPFKEDRRKESFASVCDVAEIDQPHPLLITCNTIEDQRLANPLEQFSVTAEKFDHVAVRRPAIVPQVRREHRLRSAGAVAHRGLLCREIATSVGTDRIRCW